jgi:hypothetical protein
MLNSIKELIIECESQEMKVVDDWIDFKQLIEPDVQDDEYSSITYLLKYTNMKN